MRKASNPRRPRPALLATTAALLLSFPAPGALAQAVDQRNPSRPVRLVFIHHSIGGHLLNVEACGDDYGYGGLGDSLGRRNYYVRDIYRNWSAPQNPAIGDITDIGHFYTWFADQTQQSNGRARRDNIMDAVYATNQKSACYTPIADPGGQNDIVLFKPGHDNSVIHDSNSTRPQDLFGQPREHEVGGLPVHTLPNVKEVYRQLLAYFKTRPEKMFVAFTTPATIPGISTQRQADNARAFHTWMARDWLREGNWEDRNVYVFDLYTVYSHADNHHRVADGRIEHVTEHGNNFNAYAVNNTDDAHATMAGSRKGAAEFASLINVWYNRWQAFRSGNPVRAKPRQGGLRQRGGPLPLLLAPGSRCAVHLGAGWNPAIPFPEVRRDDGRVEVLDVYSLMGRAAVTGGVPGR